MNDGARKGPHGTDEITPAPDPGAREGTRTQVPTGDDVVLAGAAAAPAPVTKTEPGGDAPPAGSSVQRTEPGGHLPPGAGPTLAEPRLPAADPFQARTAPARPLRRSNGNVVLIVTACSAVLAGIIVAIVFLVRPSTTADGASSSAIPIPTTRAVTTTPASTPDTPKPDTQPIPAQPTPPTPSPAPTPAPTSASAGGHTPSPHPSGSASASPSPTPGPFGPPLVIPSTLPGLPPLPSGFPPLPTLP
jgi:hypothetical protein